MDKNPRILVFASGSKEGGGSGFRELVYNSHTRILPAEIAAVISNYENGGVRKYADDLGITFRYFPKPFTAERYQEIVAEFNPDLVALSGWLKYTAGLDPRKTINIHPGPLPDFGGKGMYGHHVHEEVIKAYKRGEVKCSAVCMHFVTDEYDRGPVFFRFPVLITDDDTPDTLGARVNKVEHCWQSYITNLVVYGKIYWDGKDPNSLVVPDGVPI